MPRLRTPHLTREQAAVVHSDLNGRIFLEGPAGCGKTTAGVERMLNLLGHGVQGSSLAVIIPQRSLGTSYYEALNTPGAAAGGQVLVMTLGGLAKRMVDLFWPVAAEAAGFTHPDRPPTFLTMESAQYFMARVARPLLDQGFFDSLALDRNRLYSQILDNLNKSALVGFPFTEIGSRLTTAWSGEKTQARLYQDVQACATQFRQYCLENNLLDFSLQVEVFQKELWNHGPCREYLQETIRNLIVENLEEETPFAYDILCEWMPSLESSLLIYDHDAGYRRFLGAHPELTYQLKEACGTHFRFEESHVCPPAGNSLAAALPYGFKQEGAILPKGGKEAYLPVIDFPQEYFRYHHQMVDWAVRETDRLIHEEGVPPGEVVILAPYMPDSLRFSIIDRLESAGIAARSQRPSRPLRDEAASQCLLTLAALAHPQWGIKPNAFDAAFALIEAIDGMDLVRAQLLAQIVYRIRDGKPTLTSFENIKPEMQERITHTVGRRYERLRTWLEEYKLRDPDEIDIFFSRLFGEVLSQPGFRFHRSFPAGEVAKNLIDSAEDFRWATYNGSVGGDETHDEGKPIGKEYLEMIADGVLAATYVRSWQAGSGEEVLVSPAYTYLLANRPVEVQFWLDLPSSGWFERLEQPLTNPYVLNRGWDVRATWTEDDEYRTSQESMYRLILGLIRRCKRKIYLGFSELNEQGYEHQGQLMRVIQRLLSVSEAAGEGQD